MIIYQLETNPGTIHVTAELEGDLSTRVNLIETQLPTNDEKLIKEKIIHNVGMVARRLYRNYLDNKI